jgi:glycosyltransferase involved in cell wall biosynthesis
MPDYNHSPQISIILPVFEEEKTIDGVIVEIIETLSNDSFSYEIVAVEDGSKDQSLAILRQLQVRYPGQIRVAHHTYNKGYGAALRTGIRIAKGDIVVCMDSDGQHTAKSIPEMLALIPQYDMVIGYRTESYQGSWYRNFGNRIYNKFASWLSNFKIMDLTSGFRAMRREAVTHFLPLYPSGFSASLTVTLAFLKAGYSLTYIPVHVHPRAGGKSKVSFFRDGGRFFMLLLRMVMLYEPMRIFLPISGILTLLGVIAWVLGIWNEGRLIFPNSTIFLLIAALLTLLLGLIANQLVNTRIHYYGDESVTVFEDENDPEHHP